MRKLFLSYAREDAAAVDGIARDLKERGIEAWRDVEALRGGELWPQALARAIAECDGFLLLWSRHASASDFVRQEWNTALALRKPVIPYSLDVEPLPEALRAYHAIGGREDAAITGILRACGSSPIGRARATRRAVVYLGAAAIAAIGAGVYISRRPPLAQEFAGFIVDEQGTPLPDVRVIAPEFDLSTTTNPQGRFVLEVPAAGQIPFRLIAQKEGFETRSADPTLGDPLFSVVLRRVR